jgi:hypothetical protein
MDDDISMTCHLLEAQQFGGFSQIWRISAKSGGYRQIWRRFIKFGKLVSGFAYLIGHAKRGRGSWQTLHWNLCQEMFQATC